MCADPSSLAGESRASPTFPAWLRRGLDSARFGAQHGLLFFEAPLAGAHGVADAVAELGSRAGTDSGRQALAKLLRRAFHANIRYLFAPRARGVHGHDGEESGRGGEGSEASRTPAGADTKWFTVETSRALAAEDESAATAIDSEDEDPVNDDSTASEGGEEEEGADEGGEREEEEQEEVGQEGGGKGRRRREVARRGGSGKARKRATGLIDLPDLDNGAASVAWTAIEVRKFDVRVHVVRQSVV